jgi:hypothetical protein
VEEYWAEKGARLPGLDVEKMEDGAEEQEEHMKIPSDFGEDDEDEEMAEPEQPISDVEEAMDNMTLEE